MKVSDAIKSLRERTNDAQTIGYSEEVLLGYVNDAINFLSSVLIDRYDPIITKYLTVEADKINPVPKNFIKTAGGFPVRKSGDSFEIIDDSQTVKIKYFYTAENVTVDDDIPFKHDLYDMIVVRLAAVYALNQYEFDTQQDQALIDRLNEVITSALQK